MEIWFSGAFSGVKELYASNISLDAGELDSGVGAGFGEGAGAGAGLAQPPRIKPATDLPE